MASRSRTPDARPAAIAAAKISSQRATGSNADSWKLLAGIGATDFDVAESRRARSMSRPHHLLGLPLATVGRAPERPVFRSRNGRAGIPELRTDAAVAGVLQHARALTVANLPADLAAELEVVPLVVDRPAFVGLHVNGAIRVKHFLQRLAAWFQAHVGHADQWNPRPSVRPHRAVRPLLSNHRRSLPRCHIANELSVADDVRRLRGHAFVIKSKRAQPRPVLQARIAHHVDYFGSVSQVVQFVERQKTHSRVIGFGTEHPIQ